MLEGQEKTRPGDTQEKAQERTMTSPQLNMVALIYDKKDRHDIREVEYPTTVEPLSKCVVFGVLSAWAQITVLLII